jgi:signal transduction histidine kinase
LNLQSLKLRLMLMACAWVVASLVAAGFVLNYLFVSNLESELRADLNAALTRLIAIVDTTEAVPALAEELPDPRYDTPLGGRYWQIRALDNDSVIRSRSLWDLVIPATAGVESDLAHFDAEGDVHIIFLKRTISSDGRELQFLVGEDHAPVHDAGQRFAWDVVRLFGLLGVAIITAAWLQLHLGFGPLSRLRQSIERVRRGIEPRLAGEFPSEVLPLVQEVNALLEEREANTERARRRASDLAHGLKTPMAAIHGVAMRLRDGGNEADAAMLEDLALEMSKRVDYQMRLATLRLRSGEHRESTSLNSTIIRTLTVLKKTSRGENLHWVAELDADCDVDIHRQDLMELTGVMLENAAKWAASRVVVRTKNDDSRVQVTIVDDGPGIADDQLPLLGQRGQRLDETVSGTGLGLAIAQEIVAVNGGQISYGRAEIGGLCVTITLPRTDR